MNRCIIIGRMTRDPDTRPGETTVSRFTVAVDRMKKDEADFIGCVAFGSTADFLEKYFRKGMRIAIEGRIQTGSYTNKEGQKVYTTDVIAERVEFVESKKKEEEEEFRPLPDNMELPFT